MHRFLSLIFLALSSSLAGAALAEPPQAASVAAGDPPARVGRISLIAGQVSFYSGEEWQRAALNFPVTSGNAISTAAGARAEIRIGSMALRIGENTELNLTVVDDHTVQLGLPNGALSVSLRNIGSGDGYQIVTADTTVDLMRPGRFRIDADAGGDADSAGGATRIAVFHGLATATSNDHVITIRDDESAVFAGAEPEIGKAATDEFDRWVLERDREYEVARPAEAPAPLSPETTGYEELDRYGEWQSNESYGALWYPSGVAAGWAPYRNGYWSNIEPWGWSWIDYSPWGFAPFHYGRWVYHHDRWGWWPGHYAHYPVYAPALVAFVGQPHSSVSLAYGSYPLIGWFPLAPYEAYYPGYGYSSLYLSRLNRGYVRHPIIDHPGGQFRPGIDFANRKFHQAMTVIPQRAFVNQRPVAPSTIPVVASPPPALVSGARPPLSPAILRSAGFTPGAVPQSALPAIAGGSGQTTPPPGFLGSTPGPAAMSNTQPRTDAPTAIRPSPGGTAITNNGIVGGGNQPGVQRDPRQSTMPPVINSAGTAPVDGSRAAPARPSPPAVSVPRSATSSRAFDRGSVIVSPSAPTTNVPRGIDPLARRSIPAVVAPPASTGVRNYVPPAVIARPSPPPSATGGIISAPATAQARSPVRANAPQLRSAPAEGIAGRDATGGAANGPGGGMSGSAGAAGSAGASGGMRSGFR